MPALMNQDYFAILGLAPGRYDPSEISRRFQAERTRIVAQMSRLGQRGEASSKLDALHRAYSALRDAAGQEAYLAGRASADATDQLRRFIASSLEDGLLRYSRRKEILGEARRLGLSDFHAQLLIAQVQFGDIPDDWSTRVAGAPRRSPRAVWPFFAAAVLLAGAMALGAVKWLA